MPENKQSSEISSFEVEITDLEVPRHTQIGPQARLVRLLLRWQRPEYRRARLWLSGTLLASLALMLIVTLLNPVAGISSLLADYWPFHSSSAALTAQGALPSQIFFPSLNQIACPATTAWSPKSSLVAILGYTQDCGQNDYVPAQVDLYEAKTSHQITYWQPDAAIFTALQQDPDVPLRLRAQAARKPTPSEAYGGSAMPAIQYGRMLWSPDGSRLAISFHVVSRFMPYNGLFLANIYGGQTRVLFQPDLAENGADQTGPLAWDVQKGSAVSLKALPPALTYTWNAQDQLVPLTPLSTQTHPVTSSPLQPGNPAGGSTFSIWQPGRSYAVVSKNAFTAYRWWSNFAAWSPDGRYVITNITVSDLMESSGQALPSSAILTDMGAQNLPRVSPHDTALFSTAANAQAVAWNPAGTVLAVYDRANVVDLYDCRSGRLIYTLTPTHVDPLSGSAILLSWSPDGNSLLLSSSQWGLITLWSSDALHLGA